MRTRVASWAAVAVAAVGTARGQDPAAPRFFQQAGVPPVGTPAPAGDYRTQYGTGQPPPANRPRITQPVIASSTGVQPAGGFDPTPALKTAAATAPAAGPGLPPPKVSVEAAPPPAPQPLTPPRPFVPSAASGPPPVPTLPPPPTPTFTPPPAPAPLPAAARTAGYAAAPLSSRQAPSLSVEVVAPESSGVGQPLTYELVVRNTGPSGVSGVRVDNDLPAHAALAATDPPADVQGERASWAVGTLDAGAEKRLKVTVKPTDEGELRTRATVTSSTDLEARVKVTRPRVTVAMTGPDTVRVGDKVAFKITLTNSGTGPAAKMALRAAFSPGLSHPAGTEIEAIEADLPAGKSKTVTLEVTAARAGSEACVLTCSADGNPAETARAAVTLVEPLLEVKQTGPDRCLVNAAPVYTVQLANPGTAATDPVGVWTALPDGLEFAEASDAGVFDKATRMVGWRLPPLPAGGTRAVTLKLKAVAPVDGAVRTVAQAGPAEQPGGMVAAAGYRPGQAARPLEARAETAVKAEGVPALRFQVIDLEDPVEVGKEAVYEVRVMNQGTGPCTGVRLAVELPDGGTAAGTDGPTAGRADGAQVVFDPIATLPVKAEVVYRVRVRVGRPGDGRFRVRVSCDQIRTPVVKEESTGFVSP